MHEYEGRMDEYGAINAYYVKVTGRSQLSRTMLRRQHLHLTEDIPFRVLRFSGWGRRMQRKSTEQLSVTNIVVSLLFKQ